MVGRLRTVLIGLALGKVKGDLAVGIIYLFALPSLLPPAVLNFAAKPGSLAMLVKRNTADGSQISIERNIGIHGRPESLASHRQHYLRQLLPVLYQVDRGVFFHPSQPGKVLFVA